MSAAKGKRRVLITGVAGHVGLRVAARLAPDYELVVGVDLDDPPMYVRGMEFVRCDIRSPLIARVIETAQVDTIIHTNIHSSPSRLGGRMQMKEINVIGTLQVMAAAQRSQHVKRVVVRSSTAIYGSGPGEPSLIPEGHAATQVELSGYAKDCADAEQYARDFGRRRPDVELLILRTQNTIGPSVRTSITDYLSLPVVPTALGFDPRLQFLHEDDAVDALCAAASAKASGIFNIAADGVVYLSQALRLLGKVPLPLLLPSAQLAAGIVRRLNLVDFPQDQLRLVLYGRVVDTTRAKKRLKWAPKHTTEDCIVDFRDNRLQEEWRPRAPHPAWERELFDYLRRKSDLARA